RVASLDRVIARVIRDPAGAAGLEAGPLVGAERPLLPGGGVNNDVNQFRRHDGVSGSGDPELEADRDRGRPDTNGAHRDLENVVEARWRLPFDELAHDLDFERAVEWVAPGKGCAQKFGDG